MASSLYVLALMATLAIFASAQKSQYCDVKSCENKGLHSLCEYSPKVPSPNCGAGHFSGLKKSQQDDILNAHNYYRDQVKKGLEKRGNPGPQPAATNLKPLDYELAEIAQAWANQCEYGHDKCRDTKKWQVGQNVAGGWNHDFSKFNVTDYVTAWYNEVVNVNPKRQVPHFDSSNWEEFKIIGHYTQLVWAETTHVGCGFIRYKQNNLKKDFFVCNYGPAGNFEGHPIYKT